ncbi:MAG: glycosyltransferase, partial [Muribaculaceae bacterium]|nr:glycosyltransferase [Muribaculaceae bacterium]
MLTLDVLISTIYSAGIHRVAAMNLPVMEGVRYVVSWQCPEGKIPAELCRSDIKIIPFDKRGLSSNRNNALANSTADLCLIADDDLIYKADQLQKVIDSFEQHPEVEVACFCYKGDHKRYPIELTDISKRLPKGYSV